ncbi:MAG: DUF1444 family protein [Pseudomonadota bacterium]
MNGLRITLLTLTLVCGTALADVLSDKDFSKRYAEKFEAEVEGSRVEINEPLELTVYDSDDESYFIYLFNAYELYLQDPEALEDVLTTYVASSAETINRADDALYPENIVPVVKDTAWIEEAIAVRESLSDVEQASLFSYELTDGLVVIYAEDTPANIRYVDEESLIEANINLDTLPVVAKSNLWDRLPSITSEGGEGLHLVVADGNYESSLLLFDEIWVTDNFDIQGDIVVALPARDILLVTGSENTERHADMMELVLGVYAESPYRLTTNWYVRRDDQWVLYQPN